VKKILVVDDERHVVDLIRLYLEREGFAVLSAGDVAPYGARVSVALPRIPPAR
jgi:DNA-binding response OmpR family regulator